MIYMSRFFCEELSYGRFMGFSVPCEKLISYLTVQTLTRHHVISCNSFHLMIDKAPKEI